MKTIKAWAVVTSEGKVDKWGYSVPVFWNKKDADYFRKRNSFADSKTVRVEIRERRRIKVI